MAVLAGAGLARPAYGQGAGNANVANVPYRVGVNYHSTTQDFLQSSFIKRYHVSSVRATVLAQLQQFADSGVTTIKTTLWQVGGTVNETWRLSFPLSSQDLANIETYTRDVAAIRTPAGGHLDLEFTLEWLGCADYTMGSPNTTIGWCSYSWPTFISTAKASIASLVSRIGPIMRADGLRAVRRLYMELEIMIGAVANQDRFVLDLYPYFLSQTSQAGLTGSLYFLAVGSEGEVFDNGFVDSQYPILTGHRSLYWVYRSMDFLARNGLPWPDRLDFSFYPDKITSPYGQFVDRLMGDVQAVFPGYRVGIAETYYLSSSASRAELGRAFGASYLSKGIPEQVVFWPTPYTGTPSGYSPPFDIAAYVLQVPAGTTSAISVTGSTASWSTNVPSATAAVWIEPGAGAPTLAACGKIGAAVLPSTPPNASVSLYATPWCDLNATVIMGVRVATTVVQNPCSYQLSPTSSGTLGAGAAGGSFAVLTGGTCAWTAQAGSGWIHTSSTGTGSGTVTFTVDANPGGARSGTIAAAGQTFTVNQAAAACTYAFNPAASGPLPSGQSNASFAVATGSWCSWTSTANQGWIHAAGGGTGSGTVTYTIDANDGPIRSGTITVGGSAFAVTQQGRVSAQIFDLNGDANGDVMAYHALTGEWVRAVTQAGGGVVSASGAWAPGWTLQAARFNDDALSDLFLFQPESGRWLKMLNTGAGFAVQAGGVWWNGWQGRVMELNGDGLSDLFLYDPISGAWFKCLSTGTGFTYPEAGYWSPDWDITRLNLNGDALDDLFLFNRATGRWFWVTGKSAGGFDYPATGTWLPSWNPYAGDFNGDGRDDLLLHVPAGDYVVALNTGTGFTYVQGKWAGGLVPRVQDLNGDRLSDLFLYNRVSGQWAELVSIGSGQFAAVGVGTWSGGWDLYATDFNNDGRADLLLHDPATGHWFQAWNLSLGSFAYFQGYWPVGAAIVTGLLAR